MWIASLHFAQIMATGDCLSQHSTDRHDTFFKVFEPVFRDLSHGERASDVKTVYERSPEC